MDKNYSVDDILLDIKSKKSRRSGSAAPGPEPPREEFPVSRKGANGIAFAPEPREPEPLHSEQYEEPQRPSAKKRRADNSSAKQSKTGSFDAVKPSGGGRTSSFDAVKPSGGGRTSSFDAVKPSGGGRTSSFDAVKPSGGGRTSSFDAVKPSGGGRTSSFDAVKPSGGGRTSSFDAVKPSGGGRTSSFDAVKPSGGGRTSSFDAVKPSGGGRTSSFDAVRQEQHTGAFTPVRPASRSNPLNFNGHVQPITDRAKMRQTRYDEIARRRHDDTAVVDFSRFHEEPHSGDDLDFSDETRVLPSLGTNRQPDMEESLRVNFTAEADYDDDDIADDDAGDYKSSVDFSEYNSIEDRRSVAIDIARTKLWLIIRTLFTFVLTGALLYLVFNGKYEMPLPELFDPIINKKNYLLALCALTAAVALAGSSTVGGGLISLLRMRANSDSLVSLAMLGALAQCSYCVLKAEDSRVRVTSLTFYCAVAAVSMFFNALGKLSMISRIQANFKIISSDKAKRVVMMAEDEAFAREYLKGATRRPAIAVAAPCEFFTDFLALSYSDKYDVGINRVVAPICLVGSVIVGGLTYMLNKGDEISALMTVVGILCVAATFSATFIENVPLGKLTKKLAPRGGMVSGNKAVESFCDITAVALDENDLFPRGCVQVTGIKAFSQGRVDEAILDAASLVCHMESAMSGAFLGMIGGNRRLLRKVENASFEIGRGISAWVDGGRRVLLGNRRMMTANGISVPESEASAPAEHGDMLYLASEGEVCARFIVSYQIDGELAIELDRMVTLEKLLIVHAVDPNLTSHKIWEVYGYPEDLVRIMPSDQHAAYKRMTAPRNSELAEIAYTGKASAMVGALLACTQARSSILTATVMQLIQITLGYGAIALFGFLGAIDRATIIVLGAYQLFWFVIIWLLQKLKSA